VKEHGMIKCPNCHQKTRKNLDNCQYCNAKLLKKGAINKFRDIFLKLFIKPGMTDTRNPQELKMKLDRAIEAKDFDEAARLRDKIREVGQEEEQNRKRDNRNFKMVIEDIFSITGRGTVVAGKIESGAIKTGDTVTWVTKNGKTVTSRIAGIEMFRKMIQEASAGNKVGLLLSDINKNNIERGNIISKL
jgi:translation elongation factor EF-Tu-like GTPase